MTLPFINFPVFLTFFVATKHKKTTFFWFALCLVAKQNRRNRMMKYNVSVLRLACISHLSKPAVEIRCSIAFTIWLSYTLTIRELRYLFPKNSFIYVYIFYTLFPCCSCSAGIRLISESSVFCSVLQVLQCLQKNQILVSLEFFSPLKLKFLIRL